MNIDELRDFKQELEAQAWKNYSFFRQYIEAKKAELEAGNYDMPLPELLKLIRLMKKSDDYIRIAFGMSTTIKQKRERYTGQVAMIVISVEEG
jgi:hypothetical protein